MAVIAPNDMTPTIIFAGWRFDKGAPMKITSDCKSALEAIEAIKSYGRREGITAQNVDFYVIMETTEFAPLTRLKFTINTTVEQLGGN